MHNAGNWALEVKRDYFNKVAGGVRQQEKLDAHSELVKIRYHTTHLMQQDHSLCACSVSTANALDSIAVSAKPALLSKTICHITRACVTYQELCWMPGIILEKYAVLPQLQKTSLTACTLQGNRARQVFLQLDFTTASCHTHDCPLRVMLCRLMHVLPGLKIIPYTSHALVAYQSFSYMVCESGFFCHNCLQHMVDYQSCNDSPSHVTGQQ